MTEAQIKEIKERLAKATGLSGELRLFADAEPDIGPFLMIHDNDGAFEPSDDDLKCLEHAPQDISTLITEIVLLKDKLKIFEKHFFKLKPGAGPVEAEISIRRKK